MSSPTAPPLGWWARWTVRPFARRAVASSSDWVVVPAPSSPSKTMNRPGAVTSSPPAADRFLARRALPSGAGAPRPRKRGPCEPGSRRGSNPRGAADRGAPSDRRSRAAARSPRRASRKRRGAPPRRILRVRHGRSRPPTFARASSAKVLRARARDCPAPSARPYRSARSLQSNVARRKGHAAFAASVDAADLVVVGRATREARWTENRLLLPRNRRFRRRGPLRGGSAVTASVAEHPLGGRAAPHADAFVAGHRRQLGLVALASTVEADDRPFPCRSGVGGRFDPGALDVDRAFPCRCGARGRFHLGAFDVERRFVRGREILVGYGGRLEAGEPFDRNVRRLVEAGPLETLDRLRGARCGSLHQDEPAVHALGQVVRNVRAARWANHGERSIAPPPRRVKDHLRVFSSSRPRLRPSEGRSGPASTCAARIRPRASCARAAVPGGPWSARPEARAGRRVPAARARRSGPAAAQPRP